MPESNTPQRRSNSSGDIWVAVDYGGVLTNPIVETVAAFCSHHQLTPDTLMVAMQRAGDSTNTGMALLERGEITEADFLARVNNHLFPDGDRAITVEEFHRTWFTGRTANTPMLDALSRLPDSGVHLALVTNNVAEWRDHWHRTLGAYLNLFEVIIDSSAVGTRKPEPQIFDLVATTTGLTPSRTLFIDDDADNITAADSAGWHTHRFIDTASAVSAVDEFLADLTDRPDRVESGDPVDRPSPSTGQSLSSATR
ncbi:HAD family hydrolase [Corynebacterium variabile]|uniref:HAD family hydrolase n=1 Tax=Corynebacterium variabile TaxID=1727 RepID=UPI003FCFE8C1